MGFTTSKEYAELEWPLDILVVVWWVLWGISIFGLIGIRRERTLYISFMVFYCYISLLLQCYIYLIIWKFQQH